MTVELLISTMHQQDYTLLDKMNIHSDAVLINQCDINDKKVFTYNGHRVLWINTTERGLSRSRNMAIRNATADICMLADDDMEYRSNYADVVCSAFQKNHADIIGFQVIGIEKEFKKYAEEERRISYLNSMKMASVELAFRRDSFIGKNIQFDELIGAGTEFLLGEENALLFQCLRKRLSIYYVPKIVAALHIGESTWFNGRNEQYFMGKGASFAAMNTPFTNLLILQFAIRKKALYKNEATMWKAICQMMKGKRLYIEKRGRRNDS